MCYERDLFGFQRYVLREILYISIHRHDPIKVFIGGFSNQKEKQIVLEYIAMLFFMTENCNFVQ